MKYLMRWARRIENRFLKVFLVRFISWQISTPHWGTSQLLDCATIIIDEVNHGHEEEL